MIKTEKICFAILILAISQISVSCLTDSPMKIPFQSYTPLDLADGWEVAEPDDEGINGETLKDVYKYVHDDNNLWQIRSLLIFKNNKLIAESYMKDKADRTNPRAIWSCTKQVIGILTGIAVDEGMVTVTDTIEEHLLQVSRYPNKRQITIENLLMMKSGINYENDGYNGGDAIFSREEVSNSLDYIFGLSMHSNPGKNYKYKNSDPHILSAIIQERSGKALRDWAQEVLFDRIGTTRLTWLNYKDGISMGGYGIKTTPRELGKIGQLILNDGLWRTDRIVSSEWINLMTSEKVTSSETGSPNMAFGYQWWYETERKLNIMWGRGGQLVFINKDKNLIVVVTGETNTGGDFNLSAYDVFPIYDRINNIAY